MTDTMRTILGNHAALVVFLTAISLLVVAVIAIYVVAFIQGRSLSFWPPNIGPKTDSAKADRKPNSMAESRPQGFPSIRAGTILVTSAGKSVVLQSRGYTGVRATLMRAIDESHREVMVKLFWRGLNPGSGPWTTFSREYNAKDGLNHRNIVQTLDQGLWNGYPFLVLEFLPGGTLGEFMRSRDRLLGPEIVSIAEQIASGVDYAHEQGRIHRDLTPGNILLESDARGRVAISDFGIAKILGAVEMRVTANEPVLEGTPAYLAPEIFKADQLTPLVDVYGFGVILFEMITRRLPFSDADTLYQVFRMKMIDPVPRLSSFRNIPDDLEQRLLQTMDPNPERRPHTARAVLTGIENSILEL